jgi:hypothetical protein
MTNAMNGNYRYRPPRFTSNTGWVGWLLLGMGAIFATVGLVIGLIPWRPEQLTVWQNGVQVPATESNVTMFQLAFLLSFGLIGLGLLIAGAIVTYKKSSRRRRQEELKARGTRVNAIITGEELSNAYVNGRRLGRLIASYNTGGQIFEFRTDLLHDDPRQYLSDPSVIVYFDRNNPSNYFVDIDGTIAERSNVVRF